jgi:hypothetical protein
MTPYGGCPEDDTHRGAAAPLSVAALVDLEFSENAGGHVKCWQRIGEAAAEIGGRLGPKLIKGIPFFVEA